MADPTRPIALRVSVEAAALLKAHAYVRNVSVNRLVADLLGCWLVYMTDFDSPFFDYKAVGFSDFPMPRDIYTGYLASLGYAPVIPTQADATLPKDAPLTSNHTSGEADRPEDHMFLDIELPVRK